MTVVRPCRRRPASPRAVVLFLVLGLAGAGPLAALPRVVVQPFTAERGVPGGVPLGAGLARMLEDRLRPSGRFTLEAREALPELKGEIDLRDDPYFDPSTVASKGGQLGADLLVRGTVLACGHDTRKTELAGLQQQLGGFSHQKTRAFVRLLVQVVEVRSGRLLFSAEREGSQSRSGTMLLGGDLERALGAYLRFGSGEFAESMLGKAARQALDPLAAAIVARFAHEARVLAVSPDGIVLDLGKSGGLQVGRRGRLYNLREIRNNAGRVVWSSRQDAGEVEVTEVDEEGALARPLASASPREGDTVVFAP